LLKVKKFLDGEAMVYEYQAGEGKHEGRMGALLVYWIPPGWTDTVSFKIGTGFTDAQREDPPKIGQVVKFSYQEFNPESGVPRFPAYIEVKA
jgi:DNA ligase-1